MKEVLKFVEDLPTKELFDTYIKASKIASDIKQSKSKDYKG